MMLQQLTPPIPLETPLGKAKAHFYIDRGRDEFGEWVCFLHRDGTCWTFLDPDIRLWDVPTDGRFQIAPFKDQERWKELHRRVTAPPDDQTVVPLKRPVAE